MSGLGAALKKKLPNIKAPFAGLGIKKPDAANGPSASVVYLKATTKKGDQTKKKKRKKRQAPSAPTGTRSAPPGSPVPAAPPLRGKLRPKPKEPAKFSDALAQAAKQKEETQQRKTANFTALAAALPAKVKEHEEKSTEAKRLKAKNHQLLVEALPKACKERELRLRDARENKARASQILAAELPNAVKTRDDRVASRPPKEPAPSPAPPPAPAPPPPPPVKKSAPTAAKKVTISAEVTNSQPEAISGNGEEVVDGSNQVTSLSSPDFSNELSQKEYSEDWVPADDLQGDDLNDGAEGNVSPTAAGNSAFYGGQTNTASKKRNSSKKAHKGMLGSLRKFKKSLTVALSQVEDSSSISETALTDWELVRPDIYDDPPGGSIRVKQIETRPAYAYHQSVGEMLLLPDYDRVLVTEGGLQIREGSLNRVETQF